MILEVPSNLGFYDSVITFAQVELLLPSGFIVCCRSSWGACSDEGVVGALVPPAPLKHLRCVPKLHLPRGPPSLYQRPAPGAGACCSPGAALPVRLSPAGCGLLGSLWGGARPVVPQGCCCVWGRGGSSL